MGSGKHASDEEFDFSGILIIGLILAIIVVAIFGVYKVVGRSNEETVAKTSADTENISTEYDVLGKIIIEKIDVNKPILDSVEDEALEQGVIKLYGDNVNEERKFLYSRA